MPYTNADEIRDASARLRADAERMRAARSADALEDARRDARRDVEKIYAAREDQLLKGTPESPRVEYEYEVDVGSAVATGSVLVHASATEDEIRLAILEDLYGVSYRRSSD